MKEIMSTLRLTEKTLALAVAELCAREPRFQVIVAAYGLPALRASEGGLKGLLHIVTEQFLSLQAAGAIWQRLEARLDPFAAHQVLACSHNELLALGLSNAKARSFHALASAAASGEFDPGGFAVRDDDEVRNALIALPGVGPWTADIYLLSCLLRPDAWPWGDVALQNAAQDLFALTLRPDRKAMLALGEGFRPWRAVAARLLWSHYRGIKRIAQV